MKPRNAQRNVHLTKVAPGSLLCRCAFCVAVAFPPYRQQAIAVIKTASEAALRNTEYLLKPRCASRRRHERLGKRGCMDTKQRRNKQSGAKVTELLALFDVPVQEKSHMS